MFRRHWSGLPKDVSFPANLKELGYFVNDEDEIRSIENHDNYFRFFINKNTRINQRQRFAFNQAMEGIVHQRIGGLGMQKICLPLGTPASKPHVPIFADVDLKSKDRVIIVFGETTQDLGLVAGRIANGPGGINKGSMVSVIQALREKAAAGEDAPGIILANIGQLFWWPEGGRALTMPATAALPQSSLVHYGVKHAPSLNNIPQNERPERHVQYMFGEVLPALLGSDAKIDIIAIGDGCDIVERSLDQDETWGVWAKRLGSMVLLETIYLEESIKNDSFKNFLAKRARCYTVCPEPLDTPLAPPGGNSNLALAALGTPIYSSSEPHFAECILINALGGICSYLQRNALHPDAENDIITVVAPGRHPDDNKENEPPEDDWSKVPEEEKPFVQTINPEWLKEQGRNKKMWEQWEKTGTASKWDEQEEEAASEVNENAKPSSW